MERKRTNNQKALHRAIAQYMALTLVPDKPFMASGLPSAAVWYQEIHQLSDLTLVSANISKLQ